MGLVFLLNSLHPLSITIDGYLVVTGIPTLQNTQCCNIPAAHIIPLLWLRISGLNKFGLSPGLGTSRWFPVIATSGASKVGELSLRHCRESP
jgi:hypothetical protein